MPKVQHRLEHSQILLDDYLHPLFGADPDAKRPFLDLKDKLGSGLQEGYDSNGRSFIAQRLRSQYKGSLTDLESYDDNIKRYLDRINARRPQDEQIILKYFQHLSLLYTEHVLDRFHTDRSAFLKDLNRLVAKRNEKARKQRDQFTPYTEGDLTKLAYWMATGSGKTILLHFNYHQIRHYTQLVGAQPFENILLITPNAGLSEQHLRELEQSDIPATIFRQGSSLLAEDTIQIIEITKFTEGTSGPQQTNIEAFEGYNLVFVDEGHRGASGDVWIRYRDKLAADGFTFEYSATFGEAFNKGNKTSDIATRHVYGKSIVFDYSYRYFHGDGYGKDYTVVNLPTNFTDKGRDTLLLANLLTLYEQTRAFELHSTELKAYNLEKPLLMFVGRTVQTGKTKSSLNAGEEQSLSDVLDMVRFLNRVTSDRPWALETIERILAGTSGLSGDKGEDIFANKLHSLRSTLTPEAIYEGLLLLVFHTRTNGAVHLSNVRNAPGELSLSVGTSETPFGVINIGDDSNFISMVDERPELGIVIDTEDVFRGSLFSTINYPDSTINILVGAKKFTEGWSSWRVSGMGLLNVGKSEGSEVIQMFGRGVRLKGYDYSLKRSAELDEGIHPSYLPLLETLNIFSVNGNYLSEFQNALDREGIIEGWEEIHLPIKLETFYQEEPELYVIRTKEDQRFEDQPSFALVADDDPRIKPTLDVRPRVQTLSSRDEASRHQVDEHEVAITDAYLSLLDWDQIYIEMLTWRRQREFTNMVIGRDVLQEIMSTTTTAQGACHAQYYTLHAPQDLIEPRSYRGVNQLHALVLSILKKYAERFYNHRQQEWESHNLEYRLLRADDANLNPATLPGTDQVPGYIIKVNRTRSDLVDEVEQLVEEGTRIYEDDLSDFPNIVFDRHLYVPLLAKGIYKDRRFTEFTDIKSVPVGLDRGEARFVTQLREYLQQRGRDVLGDRQLYLLRNQSKGKGIGFFAASNFYPDFILWLVSGERQKIVFIDPKGLALISPNDFSHPKIQLYNTLQERIARQLGNDAVSLDSYIISDKSFAETRSKFGNPANPYSIEDFRRHHVLFPDTAVDVLLTSITSF